jgi:hypothetical protein
LDRRADHLKESMALTEEGLRLAERIGDAASASVAAENLAWFALERGDLSAARAQALHSYEIGRVVGLGDGSWSYMLDLLAHTAAMQGRLARYARLHEAAMSYWGVSDHFSFMDDAEVARAEGMAALGRAQLGEEGWASACAEGRAMTMAQALTEALREARDEPE